MDLLNFSLPIALEKVYLSHIDHAICNYILVANNGHIRIQFAVVLSSISIPKRESMQLEGTWEQTGFSSCIGPSSMRSSPKKYLPENHKDQTKAHKVMKISMKQIKNVFIFGLVLLIMRQQGCVILVTTGIAIVGVRQKVQLRCCFEKMDCPHETPKLVMKK